VNRRIVLLSALTVLIVTALVFGYSQFSTSKLVGKWSCVSCAPQTHDSLKSVEFLSNGTFVDGISRPFRYSLIDGDTKFRINVGGKTGTRSFAFRLADDDTLFITWTDVSERYERVKN
jgi:hypothetical protein